MGPAKKQKAQLPHPANQRQGKLAYFIRLAGQGSHLRLGKVAGLGLHGFLFRG
jgi:hypothetical protein